MRTRSCKRKTLCLAVELHIWCGHVLDFLQTTKRAKLHRLVRMIACTSPYVSGPPPTPLVSSILRFSSCFPSVSRITTNEGCFAIPIAKHCVCLSYLLALVRGRDATLSFALASTIGLACLLGWTRSTFHLGCVFFPWFLWCIFGGHWCTHRGGLRRHDGMDESTTHRKVRLHCATFDCLDVGERANERMGRRDEVRLDGHGRGGTVGGWEKTNLGVAKHV